MSTKTTTDRPRRQSSADVVDLEAEIVAAGAALHTSHARLIELVAAFDAMGGWIACGALSCAHWLAAVLDVEVCTARDHVRVARALRDLPATRARFHAGALSYAKVRALTRVATPEHETELLDIADRHPAGHLHRALAAWQQRNAPEDHRRRQVAAQGLTVRTEVTGNRTITLQLTPERAAELEAIIDAQVLHDRRHDASADASSERRTVARRRADALCHLVASGANPTVNSTQPPLRPELVLHRRALTAELLDGTPLPLAVTRQLTCDCDVWIITHRHDGSPADLGRKRRLVSRRLRRLLDERDRHCRHPGCRTTEFLHAHHITHWEDGGPTDLSNLVLLCSHHHRHIHEVGVPLQASQGREERTAGGPRWGR